MGGLTITLLKDVTGPKVTVDRRLYLNADRTKVVEEGDPKAASLFAAAGREVLKADLKRYGCRFTTVADAEKAAKARAKKVKAEAAAEKAEADAAAAEKAEADAAAAEKAEADAAAAKKAEAKTAKPSAK